MAVTELSVNKLNKSDAFTAAADYSGLLAALGSDGAATPKYLATFSNVEKDGKYLIIVENAHATATKKAYIESGDSDFAKDSDLEISLAAGKFALITVSSGGYKKLSGDYKGKTVIKGESTDVKAAVFQLP